MGDTLNSGTLFLIHSRQSDKNTFMHFYGGLNLLMGKLTKALVLALSLITFGIGQDSRDQTIQITFPTTGSVIDTNFVNVTFTVASFFELGDPQSQQGDGYAIIYLDNLSQAVAYSVAPVMVSGLSLIHI